MKIVQVDGQRCFICGDSNPDRHQEHHIVPKRYGGSDKSKNLVTLCAGCHQAVEKIYNKRFYQELGVEQSHELFDPEPLVSGLKDGIESFK